MECDRLKPIWKLQQEERKFTRIPIHAHASMLINERMVEGTVRTISLGGAFVELADVIELNTSVIITISGTQTSNTISGLKAKVVCVTSDGVGLKFEPMI